MKGFIYSARKTVKEAVSLLAELKGDGKIVCAGYICDSRWITVGTNRRRMASISACYLLRGVTIDGR